MVTRGGSAWSSGDAITSLAQGRPRLKTGLAPLLRHFKKNGAESPADRPDDMQGWNHKVLDVPWRSTGLTTKASKKKRGNE